MITGENKLSDKKLRSLLGKKRHSQVMIADGKGMSARVSVKGSISFVWQFRLSAGDKTTIWLTLGRYPDLSLSEARRKRDECRRWLASGMDPRSRLRQNRCSGDAVTVKSAIDFWFDNYARKKRKRREGVFYRMRKHVISRVGNLPPESVTDDMWFNLFERVAKTAPVAARMLCQEMKQVFRFCNARRYTDYKVLNDFRSEDVGESAKKRSRYLRPDEIRDLWFYCNRETENPYFQPQLARVIYISLVFGCRISEAINSTWDEWDLDKRLWIVPEKHSKNGERIFRPVPDGVIGWLRALKQVSEGCATITGISITQPQASNAAGTLWKRMGHGERWTLHDFRRTMATYLCDFGVEHYVIEQLLGHTLPGVMGIYNRSQQLDKKRAAMGIWVRYLDSLLGEEMLKLAGRDELEKMPEIERMIREDECKWLTTLPWKVRRALEKEGKFPARIRISPNFVAWRLSEVQAWVKGEWKPG